MTLDATALLFLLWNYPGGSWPGFGSSIGKVFVPSGSAGAAEGEGADAGSVPTGADVAGSPLVAGAAAVRVAWSSVCR